MGNEEGTDATGDDDEILEAPEPVLDARAWIPGVPDSHHDKGHEKEKYGDNKADPVDCEVANGIFTFNALG